MIEISILMKDFQIKVPKNLKIFNEKLGAVIKFPETERQLTLSLTAFKYMSGVYLVLLLYRVFRVKVFFVAHGP